MNVHDSGNNQSDASFGKVGNQFQLAFGNLAAEIGHAVIGGGPDKPVAHG